MQRARKGFLWAILVIVGVSGVWIWQRRGNDPEVAAATVRAAPLEAEWSATGYVECRTAQVSSPQIGRIVRIEVQEGDRVRAGQVLARLASASEEAGLRALRQAQQAVTAQAAAAQASLGEAERALRDRVARAEAEVTAARERWRQAEAALASRRQIVQANLEAANAEVGAARAALKDLQAGARAEEIAQAEAEVTAAEATLERMRTEEARQAQLLREGATSRREMEQAREARALAEATLKRQQAALELLRKGSRPEQIAVAEARVRAAEKRVAAAEGEKAGLSVEERRVEEAAAAYRAARAALAETRSTSLRLEALRHEARAARARAAQGQFATQQVQADLRERAIVAPFNGIVGRRYVDPGDLASPTQPLFSIVESEKVWIAAEVDAQDLALVCLDQRVDITTPAYAGREFAGKVSRIGAEAIPQTEVRTGARIVRVWISLTPSSSSERRLLRPGMEVNVSGRAALATRAVLAPSDAILTDRQGNYVWVIAGGKVQRRRVRAGYVNGPETEILSGLREGERVVVGGKENLKEGTRVQVRREP